MKLKTFAQTALAGAIAFALSTTMEAQTFEVFQPGVIQSGTFQQGTFQSSEIITTQQPSKEDLAKADVGADFYDAGIAVGVRSVFTNGPAQTAGLQSGDMISKVNGEAIQSAAVLKAMIQGMAAGETVKLTRTKDGKEDEVEVKLATLADIIQASIVPEAGAFDQAIERAVQQVAVLTQQIKNTEQDLVDMKKQLADQEKQVADLKAKAAEARAAVEKKAKEDEAKKAAEEAKQKEAAKPQPEAKPAPQPEAKPAAQPEVKAEVKPAAQPDAAEDTSKDK